MFTDIFNIPNSRNRVYFILLSFCTIVLILVNIDVATFQPNTLWPSSGVYCLTDMGYLDYCTIFVHFCWTSALLNWCLPDDSNTCITDVYIPYATIPNDFSGIFLEPLYSMSWQVCTTFHNLVFHEELSIVHWWTSCASWQLDAICKNWTKKYIGFSKKNWSLIKDVDWCINNISYLLPFCK